jgi:hypothetical protein
MKDVARTIGAASLLAIVFAAPTAMAAEWKHFSQKANYNQIAAWVNNTCKPKDATGIVGTISVTPKVTDAYDVHVWCRMDNSDATWAMETSAFVQGSAAGLGARVETGRTAIIAVVPSWVGSGDTVILLQRQ